MTTAHDAETGQQQVVLRPNLSLTRKQGALLLFGMAAIMGSVAAVFTYAGAWLVLPFAGFEWLLLAFCLRRSFWKNSICEVITITDSVVKVEAGRSGPERRWEFQRAWVALDWIRSPIHGHPSRLLFRLHGKAVEVGRFLVEDEREILARTLRDILSAR